MAGFATQSLVLSHVAKGSAAYEVAIGWINVTSTACKVYYYIIGA